MRSQVIRVRLIDLLPARQDMLQLVVIALMDSLFQGIGGLVLVRLEGGQILGDLFVTGSQPCSPRAECQVGKGYGDLLPGYEHGELVYHRNLGQFSYTQLMLVLQCVSCR